MSVPLKLRDATLKLESLPTLPRIAQEIMALQLDTDAGEAQLLKLIEKDPQLSARVIGLANTPMFGPSKRVTSVGDAAMLLGLNHVKMLALGIAVMSSLGQRPVGRFDPQRLWQHSLAAALSMRTLARAMPRQRRPQEDEVFLAGLLHDIGYGVLNHFDPQASDTLIKRLEAEPERSPQEIEAETIDTSHCELGELLGKHWNLPDSIVAVLRYHHEPQRAEDGLEAPLVTMTYWIEQLLPAMGVDPDHPVVIPAEALDALGIDPERSEELATAITKHSVDVTALFH